LDNHATEIESVLACGSHYTNRNFRYFEENEITPGIKVRKNSVLSIRNNGLRNRSNKATKQRGLAEMEDEKKVW
jgi:hypothetical protein